MNGAFEKIIGYEIYANTVGSYLMTALVIVLVVFSLHLLRIFVMKYLSKMALYTKTDIDDRMVGCLKNISFFSYVVVAGYIVIGNYLVVPRNLYIGLKILLIVVVVKETSKFLATFLDLVIDKYSAGENDDLQNMTLKQGTQLAVKIIVWSIGFVLVLSNLGLEISALVASLGIGGVALALAAQGVLGDLFSSFSIYMDRPFEVGDFIVVGEDRGIVKKIGLRSSRILSINGEQIIISNQDLSKARLQNYQKMEKRRVLMNLSITYDTSVEKIRLAKKIIIDIISEEEGVEFNRVHFSEFGEWALHFEVSYFILSGDYNKHMDIREEVNLRIIEEFTKHHIKFAIPERRVFMSEAT